jgi:hypothetical protein
MNRNELRTIARIMLIGVGLYVLLQIFLTILSSLAVIPFIKSGETKEVYLILISSGIYIAMAIVTVYFLFRCANRCSDKIAESEPVDETQISWLAVAFRLMCVCAGVLFLYWSVPSLIITLSMYMSYKPDQQHIYIQSTKCDMFKYIVMLIISIYLAYGAPGFVRWQVRRTLKQCGKIEEQQPT